MLQQLAKNWWVLAVRGIAGIVFGIAALVWPGITLAVLVTLFGAYAFVDGVFALVAAIRPQKALPSGAEPARPELARKPDNGRGWMFFEGLLGIGAGLVTFFWPGMTALMLVFVIAAWAIITGIMEIVTAVKLRQEIKGEWLLGLAGLASVALGVLLTLSPAVGALTLIWMLGIYAIAFGVLFIVLAFRVRSLGRTPSSEMRGIPGMPHPGAT